MSGRLQVFLCSRLDGELDDVAPLALAVLFDIDAADKLNAVQFVKALDAPRRHRLRTHVFRVDLARGVEHRPDEAAAHLPPGLTLGAVQANVGEHLALDERSFQDHELTGQVD